MVRSEGRGAKLAIATSSVWGIYPVSYITRRPQSLPRLARRVSAKPPQTKPERRRVEKQRLARGDCAKVLPENLSNPR
jgi:hypothetical protein